MIPYKKKRTLAPPSLRPQLKLHVAVINIAIFKMTHPTRYSNPFQRKLQALDFHSSANIDIDNPNDLKILVVWLEDLKIRFYKIEDRGPLRNNTGDNWMTAFKSYTTALQCPYDPVQSLYATIDWLLGVALRYEFSEKVVSHPELQQGLKVAGAQANHLPVTSTASLNIDPFDAIFKKGVEALARILQITKHPDPAIVLSACRLVIEEKLNEEALKTVAEDSAAKVDIEKTKHFNVTPKECGFELHDPVLGEAAKVLRLLHIKELRELQTRINELIVAVQALTADPKTDQALGQVGR